MIEMFGENYQKKTLYQLFVCYSVDKLLNKVIIYCKKAQYFTMLRL